MISDKQFRIGVSPLFICLGERPLRCRIHRRNDQKPAGIGRSQPCVTAWSWRIGLFLRSEDFHISVDAKQTVRQRELSRLISQSVSLSINQEVVNVGLNQTRRAVRKSINHVPRVISVFCLFSSLRTCRRKLPRTTLNDVKKSPVSRFSTID